MRFSRHDEADRVDGSGESAPVTGPFDLAFIGDGLGGWFGQVADGNKVCQTFSRQVRMNACVLTAQVTDADDCGAKRHKKKVVGNQWSVISRKHSADGDVLI